MDPQGVPRYASSGRILRSYLETVSTDHRQWTPQTYPSTHPLVKGTSPPLLISTWHWAFYLHRMGQMFFIVCCFTDHKMGHIYNSPSDISTPQFFLQMSLWRFIQCSIDGSFINRYTYTISSDILSCYFILIIKNSHSYLFHYIQINRCLFCWL